MKNILLTVCAVALSLSGFAQDDRPVVVDHPANQPTVAAPAQPASTYKFSSLDYIDRAGTFALGVNVNAGTKNPAFGIGLGAKAQFFVTDNFRIEAGYNGYIRRADWGTWDVDINLHYLFGLEDGLSIYPILGAVFAHSHFKTDTPMVIPAGVVEKDYDVKKGAFGINIGAGLQYDITEHLYAMGELKFMYVSEKKLNTLVTKGKLGPRLVVSLGIAYRF